MMMAACGFDRLPAERLPGAFKDGAVKRIVERKRLNRVAAVDGSRIAA